MAFKAEVVAARKRSRYLVVETVFAGISDLHGKPEHRESPVGPDRLRFGRLDVTKITRCG